MKSLNKLRLAAAFLLFTVLSCNNDSSSSNNDSINSVVNLAKSGSWRITYFYDSDHEETDNFSGYNFTFGNNSTVTANNGVNTYSGTWSVTDNNTHDDSIDDLDFNILFNSPADFQELTDDWEVIEATSTTIRLTDVSGGGGGTDFLTFTKN